VEKVGAKDGSEPISTHGHCSISIFPTSWATGPSHSLSTSGWGVGGASTKVGLVGVEDSVGPPNEKGTSLPCPAHTGNHSVSSSRKHLWRLTALCDNQLSYDLFQWPGVPRPFLSKCSRLGNNIKSGQRNVAPNWKPGYSPPQCRAKRQERPCWSWPCLK
jgi:hypothetical protein